jgi:cysteinyl-tRNA synthetase
MASEVGESIAQQPIDQNQDGAKEDPQAAPSAKRAFGEDATDGETKRQKPEGLTEAEITKLLNDREECRAAKNWAAADQIRETL